MNNNVGEEVPFDFKTTYQVEPGDIAGIDLNSIEKGKVIMRSDKR